MDKKTIVEGFRQTAKNLSDTDLAATKRAINRQLAYSKVGEEFGHDPITAFKVAEVLQAEQFRRLGD